jgi:hypothetical protein
MASGLNMPFSSRFNNASLFGCVLSLGFRSRSASNVLVLLWESGLGAVLKTVLSVLLFAGPGGFLAVGLELALLPYDGLFGGTGGR